MCVSAEFPVYPVWEFEIHQNKYIGAGLNAEEPRRFFLSKNGIELFIDKLLSKNNKKVLHFDKLCARLRVLGRKIIKMEDSNVWNDKKSLLLSKCCVILFMALLVISAAFAPRGVGAFFKYMSEDRRVLFLITVYLGSLPAAALLVIMLTLLNKIGSGQVFIKENTERLRRISWCCFIGAAISIASAFYWIPWLAVGIAAAFMGLIVRVIKNIVAKAVSLQDDADYTI